MALRLAPHAVSHELWSSDRSFVFKTPLLFVPLDRAGRVVRLWSKAGIVLRHRSRWFDAAHHRDGCRVARLSQINAYEVGRLARRKAHHPLPHRFAKYPPCIAAVMGPPDRNGERKNKVIVLAGVGV